MKLRIAWIQAKPGKDKSSATASLTADYLKRMSHYVPVDTIELRDEASLFKQLDKTSARTAPFVVLLDSRGKQLSSEELAKFISDHQSRGTQQLLFAVGGADGFSEQARKAAAFQLSLGK